MKRVLTINRGIFSPVTNKNDKYEVKSVFLFKEIPFILKPIRSLHIRFKLPGIKIWDVRNIEKFLNGYDIIILHDSSGIKKLQRYIKIIEKTTPANTKLFFYFWNLVDNRLSELSFSSRWEIISFDYCDSLRYKIRYVGGYYIPEKTSEGDAQIINDVFFIGINKGRFSRLVNLERRLIDNNIKPLFLYIDNIRSVFNPKYSKALPYSDVVGLVKKSKSILDITKQNQFGLTLRVYEAIFYNKKLITYNSFIKDYDFYNPNNILVLDSNEEDINIIHDFLSYPVNYESEYLDRYSLFSWIERLDTNKLIDDVIRN